MKKLLLAMFLFLGTLSVWAQQPQRQKKFDPKQFEADMEQYIVTEAGLTLGEAALFFPLFKEMMGKQRVLFGKMQTFRHIDMTDEEMCRKAIREMDECDIEIKELQKTYHLKFCNVLPASKVLRVIKAEEEFHRQQFKRMAGPPRDDKKHRRK